MTAGLIKQIRWCPKIIKKKKIVYFLKKTLTSFQPFFNLSYSSFLSLKSDPFSSPGCLLHSIKIQSISKATHLQSAVWHDYEQSFNHLPSVTTFYVHFHLLPTLITEHIVFCKHHRPHRIKTIFILFCFSTRSSVMHII